MHKRLIEVLAVITAGSLGLSVFVFPPQALSQQTTSCELTIANAKKRIEKGRSLTATTDIVDSRKTYPDHPTGRPLIVNIVVNGNAAESVMRSPVLQKVIASEIIKSCGSVGAVSFGMYQSGWSAMVGLMPDGSIQGFQCQEAGKDKLSWGQDYCGL